jgi:hypothetical protein
MANKIGFKFEEHVEFGREIKIIRRKLMNLRMSYGVRYKKTNLSGLALNKAIDCIDRVKNEMDNIVCAENPENPDAIKCYYGDS